MGPSSDGVEPDQVAEVGPNQVAEPTDHLGYEANERTMVGNARNGKRSKTVTTDIGPVEIDVPRDRESSFEPRIVRKRQRRLDGVDGLCVRFLRKGSLTERFPLI